MQYQNRLTRTIAVSLAFSSFLLSLNSFPVGANTASHSDIPNSGSADCRDWMHFNPFKYHPSEKLVPAASLLNKKAALYLKGTPRFPHDPLRANVVYGRGTDHLPTEIYAKAFDILQIANKYFQAPAAGESKNVTVNGELVSLYGTSHYTPLRNQSFVANPVQVSPFDPSKIIYKENEMWPSVIYGEPGQEILIANQKVRIPAAGQSAVVVFDKSGRLKAPESSSSHTEPAAAGSKSAEQNRSGSSSTASSSASNSTGSSSSSSSSSNNSGVNSTGSNLSAEKVAAEKATAEKVAAEKAAAEKAAAEKAAAEKAAAEKAAAEKAAAEKAAAEKAAAERAAAERAAAERAAAERAAAERAAAEKAAVTATEQSAAAQSIAAQASDSQSSAQTDAGQAGNTASNAFQGGAITGQIGSQANSGVGTGSTSTPGSSDTNNNGSEETDSSNSEAVATESITGQGTGLGALGGSGGSADGSPVHNAALYVNEEPIAFGLLGSKQTFSLPIDRTNVCFYYTKNFQKAFTRNVKGTVKADIDVSTFACDLNEGIKAEGKLQTIYVSTFVQARQVTLQKFTIGSEYFAPVNQTLLIAHKGTGTAKWTDGPPPAPQQAPSPYRTVDPGGPVGNAGGDSYIGSQTDSSQATQLKSANEQAADLSKILIPHF